MDNNVDTDLALLRTSQNLIESVRKLLQKLLWKTSRSKSDGWKVHRYARVQDLERIVAKIEPFQEDPQLLDAHLKSLLPDLVTAYLRTLQSPVILPIRPGCVTLRSAICKILYTFCKVRGEKVIVSFLNNEPRYLEPLLALLVTADHGSKEADHAGASEGRSWEENYILLLWLAHQLLAPFDLSSISSGENTKASVLDSEIGLPANLPSISAQVIPLCFEYLGSATRERAAAASVLVRLCLRPDMRRIGLLDSVLPWLIERLKTLTSENFNLYKSLGILTFLSKLVASGTQEELDQHVPTIYEACLDVLRQDELALIRSSALSRKLVIKALRCIVLMSVQSDNCTLDIDVALEEVIGNMLDLLADSDSPVRYAASKALSAIAMSLEGPLTTEIVDAVLDSLKEDVLQQGSNTNLSAVSALRWHGLTLTLGHLLYRRAIATAQIRGVLNALVLALNFEQRSATGSSIGTNVRDAANFGIWALSRRYRTAELAAVEGLAENTTKDNPEVSEQIVEQIAIQLIKSACLDPAGNIRRGSSAALQELIGRHPDMVTEGIALVQAVDYQAVGLRGRAMIDVAYAVSRLNHIYAEALVQGLLEWRGVGAVDAASRSFAGTAIGKITAAQGVAAIRSRIKVVLDHVDRLKAGRIEERHSCILALSSLLSFYGDDCKSSPTADIQHNPIIQRLWTMPKVTLHIQDRDLTSTALRPELSASALCSLLTALSRMVSLIDEDVLLTGTETAEWEHILGLCLLRGEDSVLELIPQATQAFASTLGRGPRMDLIKTCKTYLNNQSSHQARKTGHAQALGTLYGYEIDEDPSIIRLLATRCSSDMNVEARVLALRALSIICAKTSLANTTGSDDRLEPDIAAGILSGLNDYTTNERGDVGSLVRLAALDTVQCAWRAGKSFESDQGNSIFAAVVRLSLERLDKVRNEAVACLRLSPCPSHITDESEGNPQLSVHYFVAALQVIPRRSSPLWLRQAILVGFTSSAGLGSESTIEICRSALCNTLEQLQGSKIAQESGYSLHDFATDFTQVIREALAEDRLLIPVLEVLAYILDMRLWQALVGTDFKWRTLFILVQKAHFRSSNMQKLFLALDIYRGLALSLEESSTTRIEVVDKMVGLLLHPFPKVRVKASESLWIVTGSELLKGVDWGGETKAFKAVVENIRAALK